MILKRDCIAEWYISKPIIKNSQGVNLYIEYMIDLLENLSSKQLLIPNQLQINAGEYIDIESTNLKYSLYEIFKNYTHEVLTDCDFQGQSLVYIKNRGEFLQNAIEVNFMFTNNQDNHELICYFSVNSDNFMPNFIIHSVEVNPDYETNHNRVNRFLEEITNKEFRVCPSQESDCLALVKGLEISNKVTNNELIMYDEYARVLDYVQLNTSKSRSG